MIRLITLIFIEFLFLLNSPALVAYNSLYYQLREDRWEGIQPRKVSGLDIELLSALADDSEPQTGFPATYKLLFYVTAPAKVNLTVSELIPKQYYVMDKVKEKETWRKGFNSYQWPTETVIKPLKLTMDQLGVVAYVNREANRSTEVAPVVFYHSQLPTRINRYRFAFKVGETANLNYAIYQGENPEPFFEAPKLSRKVGGEPFIITWDSSQAPAGEYYELVVEGYFVQNNSKFRKTVKFYHQPDLKGNF